MLIQVFIRCSIALSAGCMLIQVFIRCSIALSAGFQGLCSYMYNLLSDVCMCAPGAATRYVLVWKFLCIKCHVFIDAYMYINVPCDFIFIQ